MRINFEIVLSTPGPGPKYETLLGLGRDRNQKIHFTGSKTGTGTKKSWSRTSLFQRVQNSHFLGTKPHGTGTLTSLFQSTYCLYCNHNIFGND